MINDDAFGFKRTLEKADKIVFDDFPDDCSESIYARYRDDKDEVFKETLKGRLAMRDKFNLKNREAVAKYVKESHKRAKEKIRKKLEK